MSYSFLNNIKLKSNKNSCWFSNDKKTFCEYLIIDSSIKEIISKNMKNTMNFVIVNVYVEISNIKGNKSVKVVVGYIKSGRKLNEIKIKDYINNLLKNINKKFIIGSLEIKLTEIDKPMLYAKYLTQYIERTMRKRISYRKLSKIAEECIDGGANGCVIEVKGRINGSAITRKDLIIKGNIRRNTLENDISYHQYIHVGKSGCVGIKAWINRGKIKKQT